MLRPCTLVSAQNGHCAERDYRTDRSWTGGVAPATLIDTAGDLRAHARILGCMGKTFLEHTLETRNKKLKFICATVHGPQCYLYDGGRRCVDLFIMAL